MIPDYIEPIVGWRVWRFSDYLGSVNDLIPHLPGKRIEGVCRALRAHECPDIACSCGLYAHREKSAAMRGLLECVHSFWGPRLMEDVFAFGKIYLWGKIVEHVDGWRAQYAYPKSILTSRPENTRRLVKLYQCEEETSCSWEKLFESTELSLYEIPYLYPTASGAWMGLSRSPLNLPTPSPKQAEPVETNNRSVPKQSVAMVKHKQEVAKSDFWKKI